MYYVSYNKATNEINCNGVKISDVQNGSLLIPEIKSTNVQIEEKTFVHFHNSPCQVTEIKCFELVGTNTVPVFIHYSNT